MQISPGRGDSYTIGRIENFTLLEEALGFSCSYLKQEIMIGKALQFAEKRFNGRVKLQAMKTQYETDRESIQIQLKIQPLLCDSISAQFNAIITTEEACQQLQDQGQEESLREAFS